ncbi:MAG: TonB-dependent receptor plug domain-containing protein [Bacteroidia bacterium]|nr:TonB-dependent receptor plug domain-containing protein [Bacteroidia bacterium]
MDGIRVDNQNNYNTLSLNLSGNRGQGASSSAIADIPLENIERIEFINGGAATTLYGSDAANGVIQIITKKGGAARSSVTLETQLGFEEGTRDFLRFHRTADLFYQTGLFQKYSIGVNGGDDRFGYSFSGSAFRTTGTWVDDQNEDRRYDLRTSFSAQLNKLLRYEASFGFVNQEFSRFR